MYKISRFVAKLKIVHLIPLCGKSKRFFKSKYPIHKINLPLDKFNLINKVIASTDILKKNKFKIETIVITSKKIYNENNLSKCKVKYHFVEDHDRGPLYSLNLFFKNTKNINNNFLVTYSDVITEYNAINLKDLNKKDVLIFTHNGFHPNLLKDFKNDFCLIDKKKVIAVKKKNSFFNNIFDDHIATGSYFFSKNIELKKLIDEYFKINESIINESYLIDLINHMINKKIIIYHSLINKFFHLGTVENYLSFKVWLKYFQNELINDFELISDKCFLLMGGKGIRMKDVKNQHKELLKIDKNKTILKYVSDNFNNLNDLVYVVTKDKELLVPRSSKKILIKQTNSMFNTIYSIKNELRKSDNYFISSSDCIIKFDNIKLRQLIDEQQPDLILFSFKLSNLQKKLASKHTLISSNNGKCKIIKTNSIYNTNYNGLAGIFYIQNKKIFEKLEDFNKVNFKFEKRIDDYFSYLLKFKKYKIFVEPVLEYIHLGNPEEFYEYLYYNNFLKNNVL